MSWSALKAGDVVEVLSDEGDAAWRPARLIHPFLSRRLYFVGFDGDAARVTVSAARVRPRPPSSASPSDFKLHQLVEARVGGAWRPGLVSKVHVARGEGEGMSYGVSFPFAREETEFGSGDLRVRLDWSEGKWVSAEEKDKAIKSQMLPASNSCKSKVLGAITPLSHCQDEALGNLAKKAKKEETIEDNTGLLYLRGVETSKGMETSSAVRIGFDVCTPVMKEEPKFHIKSLLKKCSSSGPLLKINVESVGSTAKPSSSILLDGSPVPEKLGHELMLVHNPVGDKGEELSKKRSANGEFLQTVDWCQYKGLQWPSQQQKKLVPDYEYQSDKGAIQHSLGEKRRKNSRPRKLRTVETSLEGDSMRNKRDNTMGGKLQIEGCSITCGTSSHNGFEAQEHINVMVGSLGAGLVETSASGVQYSEVGSEAENEVLNRAPGLGVDESPQEQSPLPFEKRSLLWEPIESSEIFSLMPQCPHFRPLDQYHKDFREGEAIGLMVTFTNSAVRIGKLQISDSQHKFDDILKTLVNLEGHGFDVQRLQARVVEMLRIKDNQERLVEERSTLEMLLIKEKMEKDRLNSELESIEKAMRELEHSLSHLHEKTIHISVQKSKTESKLNNLKMDSTRVENALLSAEQDFEATLSTMWKKPPSETAASHQGSLMDQERHAKAGDAEALKQSPSGSKTPNLLKHEPEIVKKSSNQNMVNTKESEEPQITQGKTDIDNNVDKNERDNAQVKEQRDKMNKENIDGMIFMCNAKTRSDCFRYMVMGLPQSKKEIVATIKPGLKLFLYDYDAKLLYGIYKATSAGGMKLEPTAFNGSYPAQVHFDVHMDCFPLSERSLRQAVMGQCGGNNFKFDTELTTQQVKELTFLFQHYSKLQSNVNDPVHHPQLVSMPLTPRGPIIPANEAPRHPSHHDAMNRGPYVFCESTWQKETAPIQRETIPHCSLTFSDRGPAPAPVQPPNLASGLFYGNAYPYNPASVSAWQNESAPVQREIVPLYPLSFSERGPAPAQPPNTSFVASGQFYGNRDPYNPYALPPPGSAYLSGGDYWTNRIQRTGGSVYTWSAAEQVEATQLLNLAIHMLCQGVGLNIDERG